MSTQINLKRFTRLPTMNLIAEKDKMVHMEAVVGPFTDVLMELLSKWNANHPLCLVTERGTVMSMSHKPHT